MNSYEEYTALVGTDSRMVAVVTRPARGERRPEATGVVLLGAGLVHHIGPNRLMVNLARRLAGCGYACVRFDHCGIGDSYPQDDGRPFEVVACDETKEVMDWFSHAEGVRSFVLLGICSGAETALRATLLDRRIEGGVMVNGGGQGAGSDWDVFEYVRGEARNYLKQSFFSFDSWYRALTGRIQYRRLFGILMAHMRNRLFPSPQVAEAASGVARDVEAIVERGARLLWVQSEGDFSRDYFETMFGKDAQRLSDSGCVQIEVLSFVDHILTGRHAQQRFLDTVEQWLVCRASAANPHPQGNARRVVSP